MKAILRATAFQVGFVLSVIAWAPVTLALFWLPPIPRYRVISQWGRFTIWWLQITCGLTYTVAGLDNIPKKPCVIVSKHQSTWETLAYQHLFPPHVWVLKRELLWIPLLGWGMALSEPIAIVRSRRGPALDQVIEQGRQRLASGRYVIIFPEGTRMPPGEHGRFRLGGARLAHAAGCPLLPVAHNAGCYWRRREFIKHPGVITVEIGPALDTGGSTAAAVNARAEDWIRTTTARLERMARHPAAKDALE
ncbi:MAG: lysophospholipid acyltransferase family protein [Acidiferrobacter sp.]